MANVPTDLIASVQLVDLSSGRGSKDFLQKFNDLLRTVRPEATTVAKLPGAASAGAGARSFVTDATSTTFLSAVAGGGANKVPVVSNGTAWLIG